MMKIFIDNLTLITMLLSILGTSVLANTLAGIQLNVKEIEMKFEWKKLGNGLLRAFFIAVTLMLLTVVVSFLPEVLKNANISIVDEATTEMISILTIVIMISSAIVKYFKDALIKVKQILNLTDKELIKLKQEIKKTIEIPKENMIDRGA